MRMHWISIQQYDHTIYSAFDTFVSKMNHCAFTSVLVWDIINMKDLQTTFVANEMQMNEAIVNRQMNVQHTCTLIHMLYSTS